MNRIRPILYAPFVACVGRVGDHQHLSLDEQLQKLFDRMKAGYFARIDGPDVLPVFLAPEWYFSKAQGNYRASDVGKIFVQLLAWSKLFPKMLIVGGSIAWSMPYTPPVTPTAPKKKFNPFSFVTTKKKPKEKELEISKPTTVTMNPEPTGSEIVFNTVPIVSNGKVVHIYHKKNEGGEITDSTKQFGFNQYPIPGFGNMERFDNTGLFEFQGIKFGIEVCADHGNNSLFNEITGLVDPTSCTKPNATGVDVQILIACGSVFSASKVYARKGGWVLACDASTADPANRKAGMYIAQVKQRPSASLWQSYQLNMQNGALCELEPTHKQSRDNPEQYRQLVDDQGGDQTRVGLARTVCQL